MPIFFLLFNACDDAVIPRTTKKHEEETTNPVRARPRKGKHRPATTTTTKEEKRTFGRWWSTGLKGKERKNPRTKIIPWGRESEMEWCSGSRRFAAATFPRDQLPGLTWSRGRTESAARSWRSRSSISCARSLEELCWIWSSCSAAEWVSCLTQLGSVLVCSSVQSVIF